MRLLTISVSARQREATRWLRVCSFAGMRTVVVLFIVAGLGWVFLIQKGQEKEMPAPKATASQSPAPRQVSEHNWAKHALDRTKSVTDQVAKARKEEEGSR